MKSRGYDAFISYSHIFDRGLAEALQAELQTFARPWYRARALRVFRDTTNLAASPGLWPTIEQALATSDWFVLMASPSSAQSPWVQREIEWWRAHRDPQRMLIALTDGEIRWRRTDFDWTVTSALDRSLAGAFHAEPFWIDLRKLRRADPSLADEEPAGPRLGDVVAEFAAPIRRIDKDRLIGQHISLQRRIRRIIQSVIALLTMLALAASTAAVVAVQQRTRAEEQARIAIARLLSSTSSSLLNGRMDRALLLAVEGYQLDPNPQTRAELFRAVNANPALVRSSTLNSTVTALVGAAKANLALVGTSSGQLVAWNLDTGETAELARFKEPIADISASADGKTVAAVVGGRAELWTAMEAAPQLHIPPGSTVSSVAVSPSGRFVVALTGQAGGGDEALHLTDTQTGRARASAVGVLAGTVRMAGDEQVVVSNLEGRWERYSASDLTSIVRSPTSLTGVHGNVSTTSNSGRFFAFAAGGDHVSIWDTREPATSDADLRAASHGNDPAALAVSDDRARVAVADGDSIYVSSSKPANARDAEPGDTQLTLAGGGGVAQGQLIFLDQNRLLSASEGTLAYWDTTRATRIAASTKIRMGLGCNACEPPRIAVRPDGAAIAILNGDEDAVTIRHGESLRDETVIEAGFMESFALLGWGADGDRVLLARSGTSVEAYRPGSVDALPGTYAAAPPGHQAVGLTGDAQNVVWLGKGGRVTVADMMTGAVRSTIDGPPQSSGIGKLVPTVGDGIAGHPILGPGNTAVWVADLRSSTARTVEGGDVVNIGLGQKFLAVQRTSGTIDVYNRTGSRRLRSITQDSSFLSAGRTVPMAVGGSVLAQERSNTVVLTDLVGGQQIGSVPISAPYGPKTGIAISADGAMLVTVTESYPPGDTGGQLVRWPLSPAAWVEAACAAAGRDLTADEWRTYVGTAPPESLGCRDW